MKKNILLITAAFFVFCLVPITTTQAMPREVQSEGLLAQTQPNTVLHVSNQTELRAIIVELSNEELKETTIARRANRPGNNNPYVKRRGYGRSTMGDDYDNASERDVGNEDLEYGDDSAIEYNEDLEDSSGYNENL